MVSALATPAAAVDTDPLRSLVSPLGGLVGHTGRLPAQPGEPAIPVSLATIGDLSRVLPQVRRATGGASTRHELDGAGGALDPARAELLSIAEALERCGARSPAHTPLPGSARCSTPTRCR